MVKEFAVHKLGSNFLPLTPHWRRVRRARWLRWLKKWGPLIVLACLLVWAASSRAPGVVL